MSCSQCNKPCIRVGGKCIIAETRKKFELSFDSAWEAITHVNSESKNNLVFVPAIIDENVNNFLNKQHKLIKQNDNTKKKN